MSSIQPTSMPVGQSGTLETDRNERASSDVANISDAEVAAQIRELVEIVVQSITKVREASRRNRAMQQNAKSDELLRGAEQDVKAAGLALIGAYVGGGIGIAGSVGSLKLSAKSGQVAAGKGKYAPGGSADVDGKLSLLSKAREHFSDALSKIRQAFPTKLRGSAKQDKPDPGGLDSAERSAKANRLNTKAETANGLARSGSQMGEGTFNFASKTEEAEATRARASAERIDGFITDLTERIADAERVLEKEASMTAGIAQSRDDTRSAVASR